MSSSIYAKLKRNGSKKPNERAMGFVTPKSDLSDFHYTRSWDQELTKTVYGYEVPVPDMPPKEHIVNHDRPIEEQIFRKTAFPKDFHKQTAEQQERFISREHHRRTHGLWFYIKGEPVYIPGLFYYFLNYWPLASGQPTRFHMGDWKFFMIWTLVVLDPTIFGLIVFKCRRIGDTEKGMCMMYEYATRVRNTINQMYDCRVEKDMLKTWKRLKTAHKRMPWYMRAVCTNDEPASSYEFRMSNRKVDLSNSSIGENGEFISDEYEFKGLDSELTYYTNEGGADGARVARAYIDEFGKYKQINPKELWGLMKKALMDDMTDEIIGKALFTSTIEDMKGGDTLETAKELWKDSNPDPEKLDPLGRTTSGLIRVVRGAVDRAPADRYGFVNEEEVISKIKARHQYLIDNKQWTTLIKEKRQDCLTIEDVFSNISKGSPFNLENISSRLLELESIPDNERKWVRGNFEWVDGISPIPGNPQNINKKCKVYFEPNDKGRWIVRWHPSDYNLKANSMAMMSKLPSPANTFEFSTGIDPVSYQENMTNKDDDKDKDDDVVKLKSKRSLSGLAVKRNLDPSIDDPNSEEMYNLEGLPIDGGRDFKTNRYCCVYLYRHDIASKNYEDWLKTVLYYGSDFLIEKNHSGGFNQWLELHGFSGYYNEGGSGVVNYKGQQETLGLTAGTKTVDMYFEAIAELTNKWHNTVDIPLIYSHLSTMEYENRGDHDLGVGIGFCELLSKKKQIEIALRDEYENKEEVEYFHEYEYDA